MLSQTLLPDSAQCSHVPCWRGYFLLSLSNALIAEPKGEATNRDALSFRVSIYVCMYVCILLLLLLYLSAHVQRTKQALGIAPYEALFKKKKHTQESLLRHYKKLLTDTQISSSTSF